jgi:hypothetical protein
MSSRALPVAVIGVSLVFFWALAWFAFAGGGTLTDPADILTQGAQATSTADSLSMSLTVEGTFTDPETGTQMPLDGVTVSGDVDIAGEAAHLTFVVPSLFGLSGEAIVIGEDLYLLTSLTGDKWIHTPAESDGPPAAEKPTPDEIAEKVAEFLATEGVTVEKLTDEACGDGTCYHVRVTVSPEAMAAHHGDMPAMGDIEMFGGMFPEDAFAGPMVVDMLFQHDGLWLRQVSTAAASDGSGAFAMSVALSNYNDSFDISAPPADQVTEEGEFPLFSN